MSGNAIVAVIGLGKMGHAIAARLKRREWQVCGWDNNHSAREAARDAGIPIADNLVELLGRCDYVLTSLPDNQAVRDVWLGPTGINQYARAGTICIEMSTIDPQLMVEIAQAISAKGLKPLDCPVSGGPIEAADGRLVIMTAGHPKIINQAHDLLTTLGSAIMRTGDIGTAKVVKLINNMMAMGNLLIACEAFALGEAAGVDSATLFDVLSNSGGRSQTLLKRFPHALRNDFSPRFKLQLADKDLALGLSFAESRGIQLPAIERIKDLFSHAMEENHGDKDAVALLLMYRQRAGIDPSLLTDL